MWTRKEIAAMYNVSVDTVARRLKEIGIRSRKLITPLQFDKLKTVIGEPPVKR